MYNVIEIIKIRKWIGWKNVSEKNIEFMRKIIEQKKKISSEQGSIKRPDKNIGESKKAIRNKKTGGLFDK